MSNENEINEVEVVSNTATEAIERASVDIQISTAKRYPRDLAQVKRKMLSYATLDDETAKACFYVLPRKNDKGEAIKGPSVRLAEIALACYQHINAGARIVADDGKFLTAQGVVHDLENNTRVCIEVKRRVTKKDGTRYSDDMVANAGNSAVSIALRNAAFRVVPAALIRPVYEAARALAIGDAKSLGSRRAAALEHFEKMGVDKAKVFTAIGVAGIDAIDLEKLEVLLGYANAIKDGEATIDEVFNPKPEATKDKAATLNVEAV